MANLSVLVPSTALGLNLVSLYAPVKVNPEGGGGGGGGAPPPPPA